MLLARDQILAQIDLEHLGEDLGRVARLVKIGQSGAVAAGFTDLHEQITIIARKVINLFDATGLAFAKFQAVANSILEELSVNCDLMLKGEIEAAVLNLESNDDLALELARASEKLAHALQSAADDASRALERAQAYQSTREEDREKLFTQMKSLEMEKSTAWETHTMVLQSLSDCNKLYTEVSRRERRATRRARVFGLFKFISSLDSLLQRNWSIGILRPISSFIASARREVEVVKNEKRLILDAKHKQRRLNWEALEGVSRCSTQIHEVKSDIDAIMAAIESLHSTVGECKRLSVIVMKMANFWLQIHASVSRLSSKEVVALLQATSANSSNGNAESDVESAKETDSLVTRQSAHVTIAPCSQSRDEVSKQETDDSIRVPKSFTWEPCTALKRKLVTYYARWAALADVCDECSLHLVDARLQACDVLSNSHQSNNEADGCEGAAGECGDCTYAIDDNNPGCSKADKNESDRNTERVQDKNTTCAQSARAEVEQLAASLRAELEQLSPTKSAHPGPS